MSLVTVHKSIPCDGESENGDAVVVREEADQTLFSVIDALGHGPGAAAVAHNAVSYLSECPFDGSVQPVMEGLQKTLRGTRGAAALVGIFKMSRFEGCSVGNVELRCINGKIPVVLTPGVLGGRIHSLRVFAASLHAEARLIVTSDGISSRIELAPLENLSAADACQKIVREHRRPHDDATVLVVDYTP